MPCSPSDISFPPPSGVSPSPIPGIGVPSTTPVPPLPFPPGFPEDLNGIFKQLQLLLPPGAMKPALNPNFGKDIYDGIMKLMDYFFPFLMLYKFFLPVLNLIICIIEVLCALMNPFKLVTALNRLFTQCIPEFLNLFPSLALIIMLISLLLLLIQLILYLIEKIEQIVAALLRNVNALIKAFNQANATGVIAIANKIGSLLCIFQNFFVLLSVFDAIIEIIKNILALIFAIPPCEDNSSSGCCSTDVCPEIVKNQYTNTTGTFQYLNEVGFQTSLPLGPSFFNVDIRSESWQIFDKDQTFQQAFVNIIDGYDVTVSPKPVFFPTDVNYTANTNPQQAAYTLDLRLFYNPANWGRPGNARFIRFNDCIVLAAPTTNLKIYDNSNVSESTGVFTIAGGTGFEDDDQTELFGFAADGTTPITDQATLNNFIHRPAEFSLFPSLNPGDGYTFSNMQYTFKPNIPVLLQKNLITLGCDPDVALSRAFVNNVAFGDLAVKTNDLKNLVNNNFPNIANAQTCLAAAVSGLQASVTLENVANFQAVSNICLQQLQTDTNNALANLVGIGFSPCNSTLELTPVIQFTTKSILVSVNLNENNGLPLTTGLPSSVGDALAAQIKPYNTFGNITNFIYDGYQTFTAEITSDIPGNGQMMVGFENQILCTNTLTTPPSHVLQTVDYKFVFSNVIPVPATGEGDTQGIQPDRIAGDS